MASRHDGLDGFMRNVGERRVDHPAARKNPEIRHVIQQEGRCPQTTRELQVKSVEFCNFIEPEDWPRIGFNAFQPDIAEFDIARMADEKMLGRQWPEQGWVRITTLQLWRLCCSRCICAPLLKKFDVVDFYILDRISGNTADDSGHQIMRRGTANIADRYATEAADGSAARAAQV